MNPLKERCLICGSAKLSEIGENYVFCRGCKTALKTSLTELMPASPDENNELVFHHSKTGLFSEGLETILKLHGKKGRLLDIGCGHGYFPKMAADSGWEAEGIEIADSHAEHGRRKFGLMIHGKPLSELHIPDNTYDAVTLWGVLDVLPDLPAELKEIYRVLKPEGILYLRVNNFTFHYPGFVLGKTGLFRALRLAPGILHRWGITKRSLETLFRQTKFSELRVYNSKMTSGDPYGTGGTLGGLAVTLVKRLYYIFSQLVYAASLGRFAVSSCLIATAKKLNE